MSMVESQTQPVSLDSIRSHRANVELVDYCNRMFKIARQARLNFERQWYVNMAFYSGKQWVQWQNSVLNATALATEASFTRLYEPAAPPWRVRMVSNKIRPIIRGELAKVTKEKPRGFVIPRTTDDADLAAAKAGDSLIEYLFTERALKKISRRSMWWTLMCGTSFIKDWYDPNVVDSSGVNGSIMVEPVSPFHLMVPDVQQEEIEDQPFVIHTMAKDPDWVKKAFKGKDVQADATSVGGALEQKFLTALGITEQPEAKRYVNVREFWIKPNGKFPQGAKILATQNDILGIREEWEFQHSEYPFSKLDHIPTGRFYAESTITDLIPLQRERNRTRSQLIENKNRMSKPQLIAPKGSINPKSITSEPGLVIFYTPGFTAPQPLQLQPIPSYVTEELERIDVDMMDIASQHEITKGGVPPGVSAATAISFLAEQDDSKLAPTISSLEEAMEKIGRHMLNHVAQFWTSERQIQVIGENGQFEAYMFSRSNIKGNTDFKVEAGSATPTSRAAKQAFILELVKLGLIPPEKALKYLEMTETGRLYEEMQLSARQAQRENLRMSQGEQIGINDWDEDAIHLMEHDNYCRTQQFEYLPDELKMIFQTHRKQHQMRMSAMMGQPKAPNDPTLAAVGTPQGELNAGPPVEGSVPPNAV